MIYVFCKCVEISSFYKRLLHLTQASLVTTEANLPNLETVVRNAGSVSLEVEEPRDDVEDAQPGGDGRVLQAAQQQHDEEQGHHLQRVLVPPLHSKQHKNQQEFRCHSSSTPLPPSLTSNC